MRRLLRREISSLTLLLGSAIYFTVFCNSQLWRLVSSDRGAVLSALPFAAGLFVVVATVHLLLLAPFVSRRLIRPVLSLLFLMSAVVLHFTSRFHVLIDAPMVRNAMQTDRREVFEILSWRLIPDLLLFFVLPMVVIWTVRIREERAAVVARRTALVAVGALGACLLIALFFFKTYASFFRNHPEARHVITPAGPALLLARMPIAWLREPRGPRIAIGSDATLGARWSSSAKPVVFVLVIGETARSQNFALNGYGRDTNPRLSNLDVISFSRVFSCNTSTADALPCMFSKYARNDFTTWKGKRYESLLDVLSHAGLSVTWQDNNSGCKRVCGGVAFDRPLRTDSLCGETGDCVDEILLDAVSESPSGENRVIVLHTIGSHGPAYHRRYPRAFEVFTPACRSDSFDDCTPQEIVNAYDNTIAYTDHVLASMIERLKAMNDVDTAFIYVSDHGESLGEDGLYLHGLPYAIAPEFQKVVPMIAWFSPGFADRFGIDRNRLAALKGRTWSHDNLFHSVLGMLDVRTAEYDPRLDILAGPARAVSGTGTIGIPVDGPTPVAPRAR